jgi:hypothetical protein
MKTQKKALKRKITSAWVTSRMSFTAFLLLIVLVLSGCSTMTVAQKAGLSINITLPSWAPHYENANLVRYYYLPDIECYYDVRNREFIHMEDGHWMFSRSLPSVYRWFDLRDCFIIALDHRVVEPWRHFRYYVSHYPRYYYRSVYKDHYKNHQRPLRGFNENERNVVFNRPSERENEYYGKRNDSRQSSVNHNENKSSQEIKNNSQERKAETTHPSEPVKYYGKEVGRPVRVQRNMRKADDIKLKEGKQIKEEKQYRQR